jgi:hypothetical protein
MVDSLAMDNNLWDILNSSRWDMEVSQWVTLSSSKWAAILINSSNMDNQ